MNAKTFATKYGFNRTHYHGLHKPGLLGSLLQSYNRWTSQRKAAFHLRNMDDHMLQDIGIERGDIDRVVSR